MQGGALFAPIAGDSVGGELNGELLTFHTGGVTRLAGSQNECSYLLSLALTCRAARVSGVGHTLHLAGRKDGRGARELKEPTTSRGMGTATPINQHNITASPTKPQTNSTKWHW